MIKVVGILNCTPDSFSDGDSALTAEALLERGRALVDAGADIIDIGGDSTRPGSRCVTDEEEWMRIGPIISKLSAKVPISVDTHKGEIARRAIAEGARIVNDVGGGSDPSLLAAVAASSALYVCMFSATGVPHTFPDDTRALTSASWFSTLSSWANEVTIRLTHAGISLSHQILDTGLGAFVSNDPDVSREIARRYWDIPAPSGARMFGCSRKGFLRRPGERGPRDRDEASARLGAEVAARAPDGATLYLRVHNVSAQRAALTACGLR